MVECGSCYANSPSAVVSVVAKICIQELRDMQDTVALIRVAVPELTESGLKFGVEVLHWDEREGCL